jgi:hypothetical protein
MHQRTRRLAIVFGGGLLVTVGVLAACSTDNGTTPTPTQTSPDAAHPKTDSGNPDATTTPPTDGGADCGNVPSVKSSAGPYCFDVVDGGADGAAKSIDCNSANHEVCCTSVADDGGFGDSICAVATVDNTNGGYHAACNTALPGDGGKEYQCTEADHCPGSGESCCAMPFAGDTVGLKPGGNNDYPGCKAYFQSGKYVSGSSCKKNGCAPGELTLCASDNDCTAGTCVPIKIDGRYTGYCRL